MRLELNINLKILLSILLLLYPTLDTAYEMNQKEIIDFIFQNESKENNLPKDLLKSVCYVESNNNIKVKSIFDGGSYSYGMCQIKLPTARSVGFIGKYKLLYQPAINIKYAAKYLSLKLNEYNGDIKKSLTAYNRGSYNKGMSDSNKYVVKVILALYEYMQGYMF